MADLWSDSSNKKLRANEATGLEAKRAGVSPSRYLWRRTNIQVYLCS